MKPRCRLVETTLGRWILVHWRSTYLGWSGERWVEMDGKGIGLTVQVPNFQTLAEASAYAHENGFVVVDAYGREMVTKTCECSRCHRMLADSATRDGWERRRIYGWVCPGCTKELQQ